MDDSDAESLKVVLLGESGVGKTSIISQLMEQEYNDEQTSTTGATFQLRQLILERNLFALRYGIQQVRRNTEH